jgi:tetratricopeptide (TPR) repeat protein
MRGLIFLMIGVFLNASILGCIFDYLGFDDLAIRVYKKDESDFSQIRLAKIYIKHKKYKKALKVLDKVSEYSDEKVLLKAIVLIKLKRYYQAREILSKSLNKEAQNLYKKLDKYLKNNKMTIIYQPQLIKISTDKEHLW